MLHTTSVSPQEKENSHMIKTLSNNTDLFNIYLFYGHCTSVVIEKDVARLLTKVDSFRLLAKFTLPICNVGSLDWWLPTIPDNAHKVLNTICGNNYGLTPRKHFLKESSTIHLNLCNSCLTILNT